MIGESILKGCCEDKRVHTFKNMKSGAWCTDRETNVCGASI